MRSGRTAALVLVEAQDPVGQAEVLRLGVHAAVAGGHDHVCLILAARVLGVAFVESVGVHDGCGAEGVHVRRTREISGLVCHCGVRVLVAVLECLWRCVLRGSGAASQEGAVSLAPRERRSRR